MPVPSSKLHRNTAPSSALSSLSPQPPPRALGFARWLLPLPPEQAPVPAQSETHHRIMFAGLQGRESLSLWFKNGIPTNMVYGKYKGHAGLLRCVSSSSKSEGNPTYLGIALTCFVAPQASPHHPDAGQPTHLDPKTFPTSLAFRRAPDATWPNLQKTLQRQCKSHPEVAGIPENISPSPTFPQHPGFPASLAQRLGWPRQRPGRCWVCRLRAVHRRDLHWGTGFFVLLFLRKGQQVRGLGVHSRRAHEPSLLGGQLPVEGCRGVNFQACRFAGISQGGGPSKSNDSPR